MGMIRFSDTPVIIEDDGMLFRFSGTVDPHITLVTGTPATEKEQGVRNKERQMVPLFDNGSEGIHAIAHICVAADHIDSGEGGGIRIPKHGAWP